VNVWGKIKGLKTALGKNQFRRRIQMETVKEMPVRIERVMELTGYSRSYIHKLVHWRKIPCHKPTGKYGKLFFLESEVKEFLGQNKQSADYELSRKADAMLNGETGIKKTRQ
jgi:predicted DNA-binding transcriptional regulator AlpA